MEYIDLPTRRKLPVRVGGPVCLILHASGETDLDRMLAFYTSPDGLGPHYSIATTGTIRRHAMEDRIAYHCKMHPAEARLYQCGYSEWSEWFWDGDRPKHHGGEFPGYRSWRTTWRTRGLSSPLDLVTGDKPNARSVGVEVQSLARRQARVFNEAQYLALAELVVDLCRRHAIPIDRSHVLGHQDVTPMRRTTASGGYDPGDAFDWNHLWDRIKPLTDRRPLV